MSKKKPKAPPPPPAPDYGTLWKQYSSWTSQAAANRDSTISNARSRLTAAGADATVVQAMEADATKEYESKMKEYQSGSTFKLLQEGYDIARGAKANIYTGGASGQLYATDGPLEDYTTTTKKRMGGRDGGWKNVTTTRQRGALNTMEEFYAGGYESGAAEVDAKAEARKKAKLTAGGASGGDVETGYDISSDTPGANPWVA